MAEEGGQQNTHLLSKITQRESRNPLVAMRGE